MKRTLILTDGGMGDLLCQLVAVDYLIQTHPAVKFEVWLPDYLHKFAQHVLQHPDIYPFSKAKTEFNGKIPGRTTQWFKHGHTPMRTHPVDYGFHMLADCHIYNIGHQKNYPQIRSKYIDISKFELKSPYVCIQTTFTESVKAMLPHVFNGIIKHLKNLNYAIVFLGKNTAQTGVKGKELNAVSLTYSKDDGIDLVNKTSMLESAAIIAGAKCYIGMDSGLTHLAGCTNTPIIAGYTLVDPQHVMPIRLGLLGYNVFKVEPPKDIKNRYFQTENSFYEGDYRTFPGWEQVRDSLSLNDFLRYLDQFSKN